MTVNEVEKKLASLNLRSCQNDLKFIIDLTSPPSSPTTEEFDDESDFEEEDEVTPGPLPELYQSLPPTLMAQIVGALLTALKVTREQESILAAEHAIIEHLHSNAATLADVEALIPALNSNSRIMGKLANYKHWLASLPRDNFQC